VVSLPYQPACPQPPDPLPRPPLPSTPQVGQQLKEALELPPQIKISYGVFEDKLKKGGKAPDRYSV
jgi:hypothetical protein